MSVFASGRYSKSVCDRCGFAYKYLVIANEPGTKWRVCPSCNDHNWSNSSVNPRNQPIPVSDDPQALEYPRPNVNTAISVEAEDVEQVAAYVVGGDRLSFDN